MWGSPVETCYIQEISTGVSAHEPSLRSLTTEPEVRNEEPSQDLC